MKKIEIEAFDIVNISLLLHTVVVAGLGKRDFLKLLEKQVKLLNTEYEKQMPKEEKAIIAEKVTKYWKKMKV